jgi:hypothetical protein
VREELKNLELLDRKLESEFSINVSGLTKAFGDLDSVAMTWARDF